MNIINLLEYIQPNIIIRSSNDKELENLMYELKIKRNENWIGLRFPFSARVYQSVGGSMWETNLV